MDFHFFFHRLPQRMVMCTWLTLWKVSFWVNRYALKSLFAVSARDCTQLCDIAFGKILQRSLFNPNYAFQLLFFFSQVEAIKKISEYVAQLRRVGKGHGENFNFCLIHASYLSLIQFSFPMLFQTVNFCDFLDVLSGVWHFDQVLA